MRDTVARRLLREVIAAAAATCEGWMVLVMDDVATRTISSVLGMYDIMEAKVTLVEQLSRPRQPFREMEVIYLITPTEESINYVLNDFQSDSKATYGDVHLFFLSPMPDAIFSMLRQNTTLIRRVKTLKEVNLEFCAPESSTFHLDIPNSLPLMYGDAPSPTLAMDTARKLMTLCVSLNEYPNIRYQTSSRFCEQVANSLLSMIGEFAERNKSTWWSYGSPGHKDRDRAILLITDRTLDPLTPLMHDYTYQSMVNDLLPVEEQKISYKTDTHSGKRETKDALLNESDDLWVEFRHVHIARVIESLTQRMQDFITNNQGAALAKSSGKDMSLQAMAAAVKELPEFQETMGKLSQHVNIASECMAKFNEQHLYEISQLEQTLSTGYDDADAEVKPARMVQLLQEAFQTYQMTKLTKIRLLAIYIISQRGIAEADRRNLIQLTGLNDQEQQVLLNLERLGVSLQQSKQTTSFLSRIGGSSRRAQAKQSTPTDQAYTDSRHIPRLRVVVEQAFEDQLPADQFRTIGPAASSGGAESKAAKSVRRYAANSRWGKQEKAAFSGGRYIVFMAGGLSYSESRAMYDLMAANEKEVVVGGMYLNNSKDFITSVQQLDRTTARLNLDVDA